MDPEPLHVLAADDSSEDQLAVRQLLTGAHDRTGALIATVLDTIPIGVIVLDAELRLLQGNGALAAILGRPVAALLGQPLPLRWPELAAPCAQVLATGQPADPLDLVVASPDAAAPPRIWEVCVQPLTLPDSELPRLCLTLQEVTAQRMALNAVGLVTWEWRSAPTSRTCPP